MVLGARGRSVAALVEGIVAAHDVQDLTVEEPAIEDVVRLLYSKSRQDGRQSASGR